MLHQLTYSEYQPRNIKFPIIFILENVNQYDNVGLIFRSADAFGIEKIMLCGTTPAPPHKLITRTAGGCDRHVAFEYFANSEDAISYLKKENYYVAALEITNQSVDIRYKNFAQYQKIAIVAGSERVGITPETLLLCDETLHITSLGFGLSINVAMASGICMFEIAAQLKQKAASR